MSDPESADSTKLAAPPDPAISGSTVTSAGERSTGPEGRSQIFDVDTRPGQANPTVPTVALPSIPGYTIHGFLGRGGMGHVFAAVHDRLNRPVALKVLNHLGLDADALAERFTREVRALAAVKHPNVVEVYDAGMHDGRPYYTMTPVAGGQLGGHLGRFAADPRAAVALLAKVARAVAALHAAGVLHRDLKPGNILLGDGDEPFVADFGLALWLGAASDLSRADNPIGTRHYMPPEQTQGRKADYAAACDVWSLGVILFEMLAGVRPFDHEDEVELYRRIREDAPAAFPAKTPPVPRGLQDIARKCLAKLPAERYESAQALADDLERWLAGEKVHARPKRTWTRRRWLAAGTVAGVAVFALGMLRGPAKSVGERLAAGETVRLIGDTGGPLVPVRAPEGMDGQFSVAADGTFSISTTGTDALAFEVGALPAGVELVAEYALIETRPGGGAGAFFGRFETPDLARPRHAYLALFQTETARAESLEVAVKEPQTGFDRARGFGVHRRVVPLAGPRPRDDKRWHAVSAVLRADGFETAWDGGPLRQGTESLEDDASLLAKLNDGKFLDPQVGPAPRPPARWAVSPGSRIGLYVDDAKAAFRNVRLVPPPRPRSDP